MSRHTFAGIWRPVILCMLVLVSTPGWGLSSNQQIELGATGEYVGLMQGLERKQARQELRTPDLHALCYAYSKGKVYQKLFNCLMTLEQRASAGDTRTRLFRLDDVTPYIHLMRGEAHFELGQYRAAHRSAEQAYAWYKEDGEDAHDVEISALSLMAMVSRFDGDAAGAEFAARRLQAIDVSWPFRDNFRRAKETALSRVYMALGRYEEAYELLAADKSLVLDAFLDNLVSGAFLTGKDYWRWQLLPHNFMKYKSLFEMGRIDEARKGYEKLLGVPQTRENGDIYWLILRDMAAIARRQGRLQEAIEHYARAIEVIERYRTSINTEASKIGFIGDKAALYGEMVDTLLAAGDSERAFEYVERSKARALVDLLAGKENFAGTGDAQRLLTDFTEAESLARRQYDGDNAESGTRKAEVLADSLARLRKTSPDLASLVSVSASSPQEIKAGLQEDEALVEYFYDDTNLHAYVVRKGSVRHHLLSREQLEQDVQELRFAIQSRSAAVTDLARKLHARLFQPLEADIRDVVHLTLVPHGALHYLPVAALQDEQGNCLVVRYRLRVFPSASVMRYLNADGTKAQSALIVGNPKTSHAALPYAEKEAVAVASITPGATLWTGKAATETAFKRDAANYRRIHLATHGLFTPDSPLASSLLFTQDTDNDGQLTLNETYDLRLQADLVTLSACETGLGVISGGDDVIGLTRGFLYAGARSILASLWPVDDQATGILMSAFYANLATMDKAEALRQAQLQVRQSYPSPYYWAGFFLTGTVN